MISIFVVFTLLLSFTAADRFAVSSMGGIGAHTSRDRLVGGERCTWGPSYWCSEMKNAKRCSAVGHCVQSVWSKQNEPSDGSAVCRWCDDLMDDIRELLLANTSKNAMRGYLKDGCKRIPDADRKLTCVEDLSTNLVEINQMISSQVPDRTICQTINFCSASASSNSQPDTADLPKPVRGPSNRNYCDDCLNFFDDAKQMYIGNYTEDQFKQMLLDSCDQAGYAALTELCKTVIEQYWPQIYARLKFFFDPEEVCYQINFCNGTGKSGQEKWWPLTPIGAAKKVTNLQNTPAQLPINRMLLNLNSQPVDASSNDPFSAVPRLQLKNDAECVVCEFVMSYLDRLLADNYTEASIQSALDRVCHIMPKSVRDDCQAFVDQYSQAIMTILSNELDPAMVCQALNLCQQNKKTLSTGTAVCDPAGCDSCTHVFQRIKNLLQDSDENIRLANAIKQYCKLFPGEAKDQCELAVTTYVPYGLQMLGQLMDPNGLCKAFKMC